MPRKEIRKKDYRRPYGVYLSKEIMHAIIEKKITPLEGIFLAEIDALCQWIYRYFSDNDPQSLDCYLSQKYGCWITGDSMAKRYGVSVRRIEKMIQNLEMKGFLLRKIVKQKSGFHKRFLKTIWTDQINTRKRRRRY